MTVLRTAPPLVAPRTQVLPSPLLGIVWYIWRRFRVSLTITTVSAVVVALLTAALPAGEHGTWQFALRQLLPGTLVVAVIINLFIAFTFADQDMTIAESSYPRHLLRLPVRSEILTFTPFILGSVALTIGWFFSNAFLLHPINVEAPYFTAAALMVAFLSLTQAITWTPIPVPHVRGVLLLSLWGGVSALTILAVVKQVPEPITVSVLLLIAVAAAFVSNTGVARARQGRGGELALSLPFAGAAGKDARELSAFSTPFAAQFWAEFTRNGFTSPTILALFYLTLTIVLCSNGDRTPIPFSDGVSVNGGVWIQVGPILFLTMAVLIPAMLGCGIRKLDTRNKNLTVPLFLATRPITSTALIGVKLAVSLTIAAISWGVTLGFVLLWSLLLSASDSHGSGPLLLILLRHASPMMFLQGVVVMLVLMLTTWKMQTDSLFADMTRHAWLMQGYPIVGSMVFLLIPLPISEDPRRALIAFLPQMLGIAVALKLVIGGLVAYRLYQKGMLSNTQWTAIIAAWLSVAVGLPLLLRGLFPALDAVPIGNLFGIVILVCLPLTRLALAPLELEANRRRR